MKTYYLFRHGETYFSKNEIPYGEHERTAEILPTSVPSIKKIAEYLNGVSVDIALRSEFLRCEQTARIIEKNSKLEFIPDPLLNEFTEEEFEEFKLRMENLVKKLEDIKSNSVAICTHGAVIAALQRMLLKKEFTSHHLMFYPKTGKILRVHNDKALTIDFVG